jgi:hypothetical protein
MAQVVECLPRKCKALTKNLMEGGKEGRREGRRERGREENFYKLPKVTWMPTSHCRLHNYINFPIRE